MCHKPVQTFLSDLLRRQEVLVRANLELEVTPMVGGYFNVDLHALALGVVPNDDVVRVHAAHLVLSGNGFVERVPTNSALTVVYVPLHLFREKYNIGIWNPISQRLILFFNLIINLFYSLNLFGMPL